MNRETESFQKERRPATYGYFVLHALPVAQNGRTEVRSTLENLQTGDKQTFATPAELGRFLTAGGAGGGIVSGGDARFRGPQEGGLVR